MKVSFTDHHNWLNLFGRNSRPVCSGEREKECSAVLLLTPHENTLLQRKREKPTTAHPYRSGLSYFLYRIKFDWKFCKVSQESMAEEIGHLQCTQL